MNGPFNLASAIHSIPAETARPSRRRGVVLPCVIAWTVFTGLALWWLVRADTGPSVWIIHEGDSIQPAAAQRFMSWFKTDIGFRRVYPWVLLGPYVALLVSYFPLERGRLRLSLPLNIAGCAAFVAASHAINARNMVTGANVVIVKSLHNDGPTAGSQETITNKIEVSKIG